jgi:hypothetical protein
MPITMHITKQALVCLALAGTALAQVAMPPHSTIYTGFSRGWSTTAQAGFAITQLDLPLDAQQAGNVGAFLIQVNGTTVHWSNGHSTLPYVLPAAIVIQPGDLLHVVGNWSPAVSAQFTANNSYDAGGGGTYSTTIEGVAHTFFRAGWQWDIGDPGYTAGTGFTGATGAMGRVIIYTQPLSGFASKSTYGVGCYDSPRMVYEQIPAGTTPIDLIGTSWSMIYTPSTEGGNYVVIPGGAAYDGATAAANGTNLTAGAFTASSSASWDDASITLPLPAAFPGGFPFPSAGSQTCTDITINSNGKIYLGATTDATFATQGSNYASIAPFQGTTGAGLPVIAAYNVDLDPTTGGAIYYEDPSPSGGVRITWDNVLNWQDPTGPAAVANSVQLELIPGGIVNIAYGTSLGNGGSAGNDAIVGFSAGGGEPASTMVDWSALAGYASGNGSIAVSLDADARPILGTTINRTIDNIPSGSPFGGILQGFAKFDPGIPLDAVGMAGCSQYASQDNVQLVIAPSGSVQVPFSIPNSISFAGVTLLNQVVIYAPSSVPNALGASVSNGLELIIDAL